MTRMESRPERGTQLARAAFGVLREQGLITAADVHRYGLTGRDASESNGVAILELGNGRGFAVKDVGTAREPGQGDPEREIALYRAATACAGAAGLLPALLHHHPQEGLLVLEGIISGRRLDRFEPPQDPLDPQWAWVFGFALGSWHRVAAQLRLQPVRPWLLDLDRPERLGVLDRDASLRTLTTAILDDAGHRSALDAVRTSWACDTTIHGDVRFANVLVRPAGNALLVDWEYAGLGDSRWDVAAGVQEYVSAGMPFPGPGSGAVAAFLSGYTDGRGSGVDVESVAPFLACRLLLRALQLCTWPEASAADVDQHRTLARQVMAEGRT